MNEIHDGIYDLLNANDDLTVLIGGDTPRIYRQMAPPGVARPYVVVQRSGGPGDINETPADAHEGLYLIRSVSDKSPAQAGTIAGYVYDAVHSQEESASVSGWVVIWLRCEGYIEVEEVDPDSGQTLYHHGRFARIRLAKNT